MPGPGIARDRLARGTFRDAATTGTAAAVRLRDGIDGWRRHIRRRQSAAAARLWSLIALGAALAGVTAGRLNGSMLVTTVAVAALPLGAGVVSVVRRRRVCAEDAARQLDAAFGFDEQVATALCCMAAGTAAGGGTTEHDRLVAELIERAAGLVAETGSIGRSRPVLAYGEWAAMAVTAAAVAAVAAVPASHPQTRTTAGGGPGRAGLVAGAATAPRPEHRGRVNPRDARTAPTPSGASAGDRTAGSTRRAAATTGPNPPSATGTPTRTGSAPASAAKGGARTSPGEAPSPTPPGASGASAAGGRSVTGKSGGSGQHGPASSAPGQAETPQSPATQSPVTQSPATQSPATQSPATQSPATQSQTTRAAVTPHGGTRSATALHAAGSRGTAARSHGLPAGDAAGTEPGSNRRSARPAPAQPLPSAGNTVLVIVLPGGDGTVTAPVAQATQGQPAGNGGTGTAHQAATALGNTAEYVPPDQNEVPFPDQGMLGRYF